MDLNQLTTQIGREQDACGIFACIDKRGVSSRKYVETGQEALRVLKHRAGYVAGEGDGCGLMLDVPRQLWHQRLFEAGLDAAVVHKPGFFVGHLFIQRDCMTEVTAQLAKAMTGTELVFTRHGSADERVLGPNAQRDNPLFVQIAGVTSGGEASLYRCTERLSALPGVHVASLSTSIVVYKVVGDAETLFAYYDDLRHDLCTSSTVMAHTRFSTNTATAFARVQPFATLGHNGEINTIARFFTEAGMVGIDLDARDSDSQMVAKVVEHLTTVQAWSLFETAELLFPPIHHEIKHMSRELAEMYMYYRALWGPFAQGPAAVMMRSGNESVFSVDALGLRPMWYVETKDAYCFSSEQGIIPAYDWIADPKPLSPGEKIGIVHAADVVRLFHYAQLQREVLRRAKSRHNLSGEWKTLQFAGPYQIRDVSHPYRDAKPLLVRAAAFGWRDDDVKVLEQQAQTGTEPIRSIGYDGPLAALSNGPRAVSDFLQETVAVVTNPSIDREREVEHFSTRVIVGKRPSMTGLYQDAPCIELKSPLLLEEMAPVTGIAKEDIQALAHKNGTLCYEDALAELHGNPNGTVEVLLHRQCGEPMSQAIERFGRQAVEAVHAGAQVIVLDDRLQFARGGYVDPFLAVATVHKALLRPASSRGGEHLRRRTSLVLRSGGVRQLHDIMVAVGLGADAVNPYILWEMCAARGGLQALDNVYAALCKGIEKVLSTLGIHELRGYERLFSAIGLHPELAQLIGVPNFCGSPTSGYGLSNMSEEARERQRIYEEADERQVARSRSFQIYPRLWKSAGQVAEGAAEYETFAEKLEGYEREHPVTLKHTLSLKTDSAAGCASTEQIDTSVDGHAYPFVISSMSFGSQGETAYRAYAEAAFRMNIVALNGEGGEIKEILERYPRNRGRQIASGRFGVNAELCNHAYVLEIKIGQGAKPGEGGHLPGSKVTEQVASARNASPGIDLISPSNNHDIYSIEDLAQVIHELRTVNPQARVAVKVPVVPNIGTIAVGIVKAGADIVTLSGFDGGTGAARAHALRYVGLPVEIGIALAHDALCEAGLRDVAEIWADGGMKSGTDAMKAILLGANRVGFGTMAMVALGCTTCRACHKDTCHVGIATQMANVAEAAERGLKQFVPQEFDHAVANLTRWFTAVGEHIRSLTRQLGATRTQELVGRRDLLQQFASQQSVDLQWMTSATRQHLGSGTAVKFRDWEDCDEELASMTGAAYATGTEGMAAGMHPRGAVPHLAESSRDYGGCDNTQLVEPIRVLGTRESGAHVRTKKRAEGHSDIRYPGVAGNGFAAFHTVGMHSTAMGGAQDGVGKGAYGGKIVVLKHRGPDGTFRGGSVGKGLAYGAQHGLFIVQGNADARAGIRLSGADVIIGGEVAAPLQDDLGYVGARANIAGFGFEYMTSGRALVLGDPGPWLCSGMTGGVVYVRHDQRMGLTEAALRRRIAQGAKVHIRAVDEYGISDVRNLLLMYQKELRRSGQPDVAKRLLPLMRKPADHFLMIVPGQETTDQDIATE